MVPKDFIDLQITLKITVIKDINNEFAIVVFSNEYFYDNTILFDTNKAFYFKLNTENNCFEPEEINFKMINDDKERIRIFYDVIDNGNFRYTELWLNDVHNSSF